MNNNANLIIGYGLAAFLYVGYTVSLLNRRRSLRAALASVQADDQDR